MRLKVQFSVGEVADDGSTSEVRFVTFGDEVDATKVRDFFDRAGIAVEQLFNLPGAPAAAFLDGPCSNKIQVIKCVRELTHTGLKEAKDLVESNGPLFILQDGRLASDVLRYFDRHGIRVRCEGADLKAMLRDLPQVPTVVNLPP